MASRSADRAADRCVHRSWPSRTRCTGRTCAEKIAFMTAMYWEGTSGAAASTSSRAGCVRCPTPVPPPLPSRPSARGAPPGNAAAAWRCWELMKHSARLSALLSWQAAPPGGAAPAAAATSSAAANVCCSPDSTAADGGPATSAAAPAPAAADGRHEGEQYASWHPAAPAVNTASRLASFSSKNVLTNVSSCREAGGGKRGLQKG